MTNQRGSEMTPRGRVCTLGLREMRVSGNRFPTTGSLHGLHNCKVHLEVPSKGRPSPTNWDESTLDSGECGGETNVGNKQLCAAASDYASLETWWTGCADGVHHILRQARKPAIKSISASSLAALPYTPFWFCKSASMFLCCNTRVSVVILEYFSGSISTLQPILAAGRASLLARPTSECHLLRAFFPERRRFRKWCRSFNRSQQHDDPVTELKQTQTRSRSEMGSEAEECFLGRRRRGT